MAQQVAVGPIQTYTHTVGTVGTVTGTVLAANTARKYARFQNASDTVIYLMATNAAVASQGIYLAASGGAFEVSYGNGNLTTEAFQAISSATGKVLLITEGS